MLSELLKPGSVNADEYASGWPGITIVGPLKAASVGADVVDRHREAVAGWSRRTRWSR